MIDELLAQEMINEQDGKRSKKTFTHNIKRQKKATEDHEKGNLSLYNNNNGE